MKCAKLVRGKLHRQLDIVVQDQLYSVMQCFVSNACNAFILTSSGCVQFWSALYAHFSHLQQMGKQGVAVSMPSLATVG